MRYTISILSIILITGFFETKAQSADTLNVYCQALKLHLANSEMNANQDAKDTVGVSKYFIEEDIYTTSGLPHEIHGCFIEVLTQKEIYAKTRHKNQIHLIAIRPARWNNGKLIISVIDFKVTRKRKHFYYSNCGGSSFEITGEELNKLRLKTIKKYGI